MTPEAWLLVVVLVYGMVAGALVTLSVQRLAETARSLRGRHRQR